MTTTLNTPVFIIGLERFKAERYQKVLGALKEIGVEATVWRAVDGFQPQPIELEPGESVRRFHFFLYVFWGRGLRKRELACYLSHYRLWKHAFEKQNYERIVVLEDDIVFDAARFKEALENIAKLDQAFEYIQLKGEDFAKVRDRSITADGAYALYELDGFFMSGAFGYALSRRGFDKLLPHLMPIDRAFDGIVAHSSPKAELRAWTALPVGLCGVDPSIPSAVQLNTPQDLARLRYRRFVKLALTPARWIYKAWMITDWYARRRVGTGRFAYAQTPARAPLYLYFFAFVIWDDLKRQRPLRRLAVRAWRALKRNARRG